MADKKNFQENYIVRNKLDEIFRSEKKSLLNIYCTAGFPELDSTGEVIKALQKYGADMIEIGIPYSDPVADGPVIQQSNMIALQNGMDIHYLFQQLYMLKKEIKVPVILMGYFNPIMQFGVSAFCRTAANAGVSGVIIPDLPMKEFEKNFRKDFLKNDLHFIFLISPDSDMKRIREADRLSGGFLYAVSSSKTTGEDAEEFNPTGYKHLKEMQLKNPVMMGFGISDRKGLDKAGEIARGGIIGSAYIKTIRHSNDIEEDTRKFLEPLVY